MKSKIGPYGSGIGGPVQVTDDPNDPSFDAATADNRDSRIRRMIESPAINEWERSFLVSIYGMDRMSAKQVKKFIAICYRYKAAGGEA